MSVAFHVAIRAALIVLTVLALPRMFIIDVTYYWSHAHGLSIHQLPYRDFLWEYPPVSALPLLLGPLSHGSIGVFRLLFAGAMAVLEYLCMVALEQAWPDRAAAIERWWLLLALPISTIAWFRLDFVAVLPAAVCLAALERGRSTAQSAVVGIAAKLWPAVFGIALVVRREWRQLWAMVGATAAVFAGWYAFSPSGLSKFLEFRKGSGLQIESTLGALIHLSGAHPVQVSNAWVVEPGGWSWVDPVGLAIVVAGALCLAVGIGRWRVRSDRLVEFLGACVVALLLGSRLLSPHFLAWLLPFVVLAAVRDGKRLGIVFAASIACTMFTLSTYGALLDGAWWAITVVLLRNGLLALLGWSLLRRAIGAETSRSCDPAELLGS